MSLLSVLVTAVAIFDYKAIEIDEITLTKGEEVEVLLQQEDEWWLVKSHHGIGCIPGIYCMIVNIVNNVSDKNKALKEKDNNIHDKKHDFIEIAEVKDEAVSKSKALTTRIPPKEILLDGWESAIDKESGDTFYYNYELG